MKGNHILNEARHTPGAFEFDLKTVLYALVCALGPYACAALLVLLWQL